MSQRSIPALVMRGGTSRGVFLEEKNVPKENRDKILPMIMGSPDPIQVDGLGGGVSSTSKVMILEKNDETDEVDYLFAQIHIEKAITDYNGNCGNLTSAIAPYAVDAGMVKVPVTERPVSVDVRIYNINTNKHIVSTFNVLNGKTDYTGNNHVTGVPGTGAKVRYKILDPVGTLPGKPVMETLMKMDFEGRKIEVSVMDITTVYAFIEPDVLGLEGSELPPEVNSNKEVLDRADRLRRAIVSALGDKLPQTKEFEESPMALRIVMVSKMRGYRNWLGTYTNEEDGDILVRAFSLGKMHHAIPFTAALCLAAAAKIPGSIVHRNMKKTEGNEVRIAHSKGIAVTEALVELDGNIPIVKYVGGSRTVRPIMKGEVFVQS